MDNWNILLESRADGSTVATVLEIPDCQTTFDLDAENCYQVLRQNSKTLAKKKIEKDLRIASIALALDATIVTRNYKDFSQIPNLKIENWEE